MFRVLGFALNIETRRPYIAAQQRIKRVGYRKDSRQSFEAFLQLGIEISAPLLCITVERRVDTKDQDVARVKTGINVFEIS